MKDQIKSVKQRYLHGVIKRFIYTYIIDMEMFMKHFSNIDLLQEWKAYQKSQVTNEDGRFPCRFTVSKASFRYDGRSRRQHELSHDPPPDIRDAPLLEETRPDQESQENLEKDDVFDCHCSLMNMSLLLRNY